MLCSMKRIEQRGNGTVGFMEVDHPPSSPVEEIYHTPATPLSRSQIEGVKKFVCGIQKRKKKQSRSAKGRLKSLLLAVVVRDLLTEDIGASSEVLS